MNHILILVCIGSFVVGTISAVKSGGGYKEAIVKCDNYIDSLINNIMIENGDYFDPHPINESILFFRKKVIFVDLSGEAKLSEGVISGLRNLKRVSSCSLSMDNSRLRLSAHLQTGPMFFNFSGSVKVMKMGPTIYVRGNCSNSDIVLAFTMNATTGREALLEMFDVKLMRDVIASVDGLRFLSWVNEPMSKSAVDFFKALVKKLVEEEMRKQIEEKMIQNPFSLEEFDIDVDEIDKNTTTTEDPYLEGKLVYTKEDSNSYIDSVLENRYLLETHYSKMDPYILEDSRIENIFVDGNKKNNYMELTDGSIEDLLKMRRIKDCSQPVLRHSNITFICHLGFDKIAMKYLAKAFNGDLESNFEIISEVLNTRLSTKITTNIKDNVPDLLNLSINNLGKFTIKAAQVIAEAPLYFNSNSFDQSALLKHFKEIFRQILDGRLKNVLSYSIYKTPIHFIE